MKYTKECCIKSKISSKNSPLLWGETSPLKVSSRCLPTYQHTVSKFGNLNKSAVLSRFSISYALTERKKERDDQWKSRVQYYFEIGDISHSSSHRSCMSMLRLCRKFPPNAKQSTGVKTAWIHPEADNYHTKNHHSKSNCNFSVTWDMQTTLFLK